MQGLKNELVYSVDLIHISESGLETGFTRANVLLFLLDSLEPKALKPQPSASFPSVSPTVIYRENMLL